MFDKIFEDIVFVGGKVKRMTVLCSASLLFIENKYLFCGLRRFGLNGSCDRGNSAVKSIYFCDENLCADGFFDIVVGARDKA